MRQAVKELLPEALVRMVRAHRVRRELDNFAPRRATHKYGSRELTIELRDGLAEAWYDGPGGLPPEVASLPRLDGLVFYLGAHQAVIAMMLAERAARVIAVEAEPHNARMAEVNRALNDIDNLEIVHAAVCDHPGTVRFEAGLNGHISDGRAGTVEVTSTTVDMLTRRFGAPEAVICDVEGYEGHVIRGARRTIRDVRPDWLIELHGPKLTEVGGDPSEIVAALAGYTLKAASIDEPASAAPVEDVAALNDRCYLLALAS